MLNNLVQGCIQLLSCVFSFRLSSFLLQWIDREGKTPLIVACMNHELFDIAKTLIELGANANAYRPGMLVKVLTLSNGLLVIMLQMIVAIWLWVIFKSAAENQEAENQQESISRPKPPKL